MQDQKPRIKENWKKPSRGDGWPKEEGWAVVNDEWRVVL
jgi:hypothetical protein